VKGQKGKKRVSLSISSETKAMLDSVRHPGQSYNGLLRELVASSKKRREGKDVS
jgi:hypothetical protein